MPSPTVDIIQAIVTRLQEACANGTREPTAVLTADEHRAMLELHVHDPMAAGVVLQHVREHARTLENWTEPQVARLNFRLYERGAAAAIRDTARAETTANVVQMAAARNARVRRARTHDVTGDVAVELSVPQMLETSSPVLVAYGILKQQREGRVWYDGFYKATLTDWRGDAEGTVIPVTAVTDAHVARVQRWLHARDARLNRISMVQVNQLLDAVAHEDERNEPQDWLVGLAWDGVARLPDLFSRGFGAANSAFNRESGRCWFVSMAARVLAAGSKVDTMPVLIGPQGIRKSQALEVIGGEWYRAAASNIDSKDFLQELHGALVFEMPELHSMMGTRMGSAKIKAVLSTRIDHFRLPYGMRVAEHKRTAVIVGTTNNRDWHTDETGARRFWPVHCGDIDLDWLREWRAQLFAEACAYYVARQDALVMPEPHGPDHDDLVTRGQWWNVPEAEQAELMDAETFVTPMQEMIAARLSAELARGTLWLGQQPASGAVYSEPVRPWDGTASESTEWGNLLTVTRIGVHWLGMTPETLGRGSAHGKTIGACMRALGWTAKQVRLPGTGDRVKAYVPSPIGVANGHAQLVTRPTDETDETIGDTRGQGDIRSDDEDDIPF